MEEVGGTDENMNRIDDHLYISCMAEINFFKCRSHGGKVKGDCCSFFCLLVSLLFLHLIYLIIQTILISRKWN